MKSRFIILFLSIIFFGFNSQNSFAQKSIEVKGIVLDEFNNPIPFAAISILKKNRGTSSTEDGEFSLKITSSELEDMLSFTSLGFNPFKIKIKDYLAQAEKKIVLKETVFEMDEITIVAPKTYVINALKKLKDNTLSKPHQIELLYRRAATEGGKSKFFVENYIKIRDRGPASPLGIVEVTESRKSADYRIWKRKQWTHDINWMITANPLRPTDRTPNLKKYKWEITGETSYEGEEVLIFEGTGKNKWDKVKLYIGVDSYGVFRIERNKAIMVYKRHENGKLYLSYYANEWGLGRKQIPQKYWNTDAEEMSYRLEAFVYKVETDKKKIDVNAFGGDTDMGSLDLPYNAEFWKNLSMPPDTKFFKQIKKELEGNFGVPLEVQYNLANQ
ncbi:hypothetical protein BW723_04415 [Polaribacter reichenbachii]|uniref:Carboxypeptidase-like regulatory domain-containing protein n=1 Tax=Polaribacter reichenbachii TaxID=996801 RepID=A0A1B8TV60_9FLAO|nr:carboxypeptidase-like regulatory domain-containing protein [Polaribacter reichenbachii]APZ45584.1 hypothetical protein BW723_04415 [Polaribacter reichenbachii]AUC19446.1 hypothetical protein BTO17_12420 [Polaribacter reichenbachii]OBY63399.1 hypothetical protein LPB301_11295 [Polaribacter reichenbachii]